jgi:hypothetical protein
MEKFFNTLTVNNASEWLYHHPEDERFLPAVLPEPCPISLDMIGGPKEFGWAP